MRRKRAGFDIFNLSFLDIISCGFGAVVLLVLISKFVDAPDPGVSENPAALLEEVLSVEARLAALEKQLAEENDALVSKQLLLDRMAAQSEAVGRQVQTANERAQKLAEDVAGLEAVQQSLDRLKRTSISAPNQVARDDEVGGIPVDSDHVIFIVDTSGSMQQIWGRVVAEVENVIRIHPKIKGFQVLNDNGAHLLSAFTGRWIPDTPSYRKNTINLLKSWQSASNSSPVEGLEIALKRYVNPNTKVSIYIFGDEYSGSSYDPVINALFRLNTNRVTGDRLARVHAVGFISPFSTGRFAVLMREVTRRNDGTFLALPRSPGPISVGIPGVGSPGVFRPPD